MWNAHSHASEVLQHKRNASLSQAHLPTIDLHTLHVEEALKVLRSFAHDCIAKHGDGVRCHIICGVGKHSKAKASLPSAVVSELQKPGILYTEAAPGTLEVQLHRSQVIRL
jgi:DNA-nicking Smr family endonuclease